MFTGIVEELGTVFAVEDQGDAVRLSIRAETVLSDVGLGDSIAVSGCCLTVVSTGSTGSAGEDAATDLWTADVMQETLDKTSLRGVQPGDRVNLERAVTVDKRLGGHLVQGHVDAVGTVRARTPSEHWDVVDIQLPGHLAKYVVDKGSITVDGVSLTVVRTGPVDAGGTAWFTVSLIPETLTRTTLGTKQPGDLVNLEVDVIAKHVEKLVHAYVSTSSTTDTGVTP